jgi:hypothetical protein
MVELKVRKFGNSLGVVLPKEVINRLHTGDGEPLFLIEAPEGGYQAHALRSRLRGKDGKGGRHHQPLPQYTARSRQVKAPVWIDERDALALHDSLLALHGGAVGLRDNGLLKSALARPRQHFAYAESPDIVDMAAAYTGRHRAQPPLCRWQQAHGLRGGNPVSRTQWLPLHRQRGRCGAGGPGVGERKPRRSRLYRFSSRSCIAWEKMNSISVPKDTVFHIDVDVAQEPKFMTLACNWLPARTDSQSLTRLPISLVNSSKTP